jgi:hypothetical protein
MRSQASLPLADIHVSVRQNTSQDDFWLTAEAVERRRRYGAFQVARHRDADPMESAVTSSGQRPSS